MGGGCQKDGVSLSVCGASGTAGHSERKRWEALKESLKIVCVPPDMKGGGPVTGKCRFFIVEVVAEIPGGNLWTALNATRKPVMDIHKVFTLQCLGIQKGYLIFLVVPGNGVYYEASMGDLSLSLGGIQVNTAIVTQALITPVECTGPFPDCQSCY